MRKTLVLILFSLLLLWAARASASYRSMVKPRFGDPDEFQALRYHDETGVRFAPACKHHGVRKAAKEERLEEQTGQEVRRYLSIGFAGRTFFLER